MIGTRRPDTDDGSELLAPGEYQKVVGGAWIERVGHPVWTCCTPNGHAGNLQNHTIVEHEDGTITVSPSIAVSRGGVQVWHGFLERGVWRSC